MPSPNKGLILIVEDDKNIAALVEKYILREGFDAIIANNGRKGLDLAKSKKPDLIILDIMLPELDGWGVCNELRKDFDIPVLMLTAREEEVDRILGFSLGADDYVVKPFSPRELVERVKAILRRTQSVHKTEKQIIKIGDVSLDPEKYAVTLNDQPVSLTPSEYSLLFALMTSPGRVFTRDELLNHLYKHGEVVVDRVVDVHIGKIRQKLEVNPAEPHYIRTMRGIGYCFADT
ncbi:MAG: response regulator transcription factor [Gammaproteobacteria bacterium]|nr:response regulator transcription factor [Gammaproteobacteria bacterium]MDH5593271.1 response regulator transcription factor [Gammaproteobacteria bacterium]MDH5613681.1 response regulator transcription factor [Gammaproteobacteria bacterium]